MRAKIVILVFGVLIGFSVNFLFWGNRQDQKAPERVVYYTTSIEEAEEESPVTEEQAEKLKKLGFSANLVPITTVLKNGGRK